MKKLILSAIACILVCTGAFSAEKGFLKGKILKIDMKESIDERGGSSFNIGLGGISSSSTVSLLGVERALEKAAEDKEIAMIYLNLDHFSGSMSVVEEVRSYLKRFSAAGKPVVAWAAGLSNGSYYLGSVADRLFLHPQGGGTLNGLGSTQYFLKDLLDTLGLEIQLIRHGKYKSAGEMYIRNDISPENRLQYEELLGSIWGGFLEEISESRGISVEKLNAMIDGLELGTANTWLDKGLVDGLKYRDEMEDYLCHLFGTTHAEDVRTVSLKDYIKGLKKGPSSKKIAIIYAEGEIVRSGGEIVGEKLAREIAAVRADSSVKAVVFRVNSPGGEVVAADMIRREIELLGKDKPVIASYGSYAASGGYLISAGCRRIFVDNATLTGSIGVFGLVPSYGNAVRKNLHVNLVNVGTSAHSSMGTGVNPLTAEEEAWYQQEIEGIYDTFVGVVAKGRSMSTQAVDDIAQGRVWSGKDALGNGLADEKGTLLDAVKYTAGLVGLKSYGIECYPEKKSFLESLKNKDEKKKEPLARVKQYIRPGFSAMALMPYFSIENLNVVER